MDPPTTSPAPRRLVQSRCSPGNAPGKSRSTEAAKASVPNGVRARTALTREASQWSSASANDPYATTVLRAQYATTVPDTGFRPNSFVGTEEGNNMKAANT